MKKKVLSKIINRLGRYAYLLPFVALILNLVCCKPSTDSAAADDVLNVAVEAMDGRDYASAAELLDKSRQSTIDGGDVTRMVQYSILYMRLADVSDTDEYVGAAYQCLSQAFAVDSAATADYINALSLDDMSQVSAVKTLLGAAGMMSFHDDSEYPDSLFANQEEEGVQL